MLDESISFGGRPVAGFALNGTPDLDCVVPLKWWQASAIAVGASLLGATAGGKIAKSHPTAGPLVGAAAGLAAVAPFVATFPGSWKTPSEAQTLPSIGGTAFMSPDPPVCVNPMGKPLASLAMGAPALFWGSVATLVHPKAGVVVAAAVGALAANFVARPPFSERTAADMKQSG